MKKDRQLGLKSRLGVSESALSGVVVTLFVWDGTLLHAQKNLPMLEWVSVSAPPHSLLRFPCRVGNGSIPAGGWILLFGGHIADYGFPLPGRLNVIL